MPGRTRGRGCVLGAIRKSDSFIGVFTAVCAFAGMRLGEVNGLRVSDIDFLRKEIRVQRQVQWPGGSSAPEVRPPKYGSERTVYIPDGLVRILSEYIRVERPGTDADRWLFPGHRDRSLPAHKSTIAAHWRKVRAAVKIGHTLHDLRHFYASGLIAAGCDVVTVQRALGHSSPSITLDTDSHLWPKADDRTRNAAAGLFDAALGSAADCLRTEGLS